MKSILILAAENSAEAYGCQVVEYLSSKREDIRFFGVGGDAFARQGVDVIIHNREFAIIGIIEIISSIFRLRRHMKRLLREAKKRKAAAALLIDYPDFNLRLARKLKKAEIPVYYYISPTVWAWRYHRVKLLRKFTDHVFIIFPFERDIFTRENIPFTYTGHPLLSKVRVRVGTEAFRQKLEMSGQDLILGLLPGSRRSEVRSFLPEMLRAVKILAKNHRVRVLILRAHSIESEQIQEIVQQENVAATTMDQSSGYDMINACDLVVASCGTSNLEIAIIGKPFVVVYRLHWLSYLLGIRFIKIRNYSIVNILAGERVVPELIQKDFTASWLAATARDLLGDVTRQDRMRERFAVILDQLAQDHDPSEIIGKKLLEAISD